MIRILPYQEMFEEGVRLLCRIPVSGNISLTLEREPSYLLGAKVQCEQEEVYVAWEDQHAAVWAVFNIGKRRLWHQHELVWVRYMCDLRIHPDKQNSSLLFSLIKKFKELTQDDVLPAQTVVFRDNYKMNSFIDRVVQRGGSSGIPHYHPVGQLNTYLCAPRGKQQNLPGLQVRKASREDLPVMQAFMDQEGSQINYFPYYNFAELGNAYYRGLKIEDFYLLFENGKLVGMTSIWDQGFFKQTRIAAYSSFFRLARPFYNMVVNFSNKPKLPPAGEVLHYCYLHCILIAERNPTFFEILLRYIQNDLSNRSFDYLFCSLDANDPLVSTVNRVGYLRKISGNYFLVNLQSSLSSEFSTPFFYLEGARI